MQATACHFIQLTDSSFANWFRMLGLMAVNYLTEFAETMTPNGYAVVQALLRRYIAQFLVPTSCLESIFDMWAILKIFYHPQNISSYGQYGTGSIAQDCEDLDELVETLVSVCPVLRKL